MRKLENKQAPAEVISHDVTPITVNTDAGRYAKFGWLIVLVGVGGFILWALFAPLDKGVPLQGTLAKESNRKTIQHQTGGTVEDILVKDGDVVKAGQVLVRMNAVQARAQTEVGNAQYINARSTEARLLGERDGKETLLFPPALASMKNDPRVTATLALQSELMASRRAALRSDVSATEATINGLKEQLKSTRESREGKKEQLAILKEQRDNMRDLAKDGYVARGKLLDLERAYLQLNGSISEDNGSIARTEQQVLELGLRRNQRIQEYQKEVRTTLADVQREAASLESRLVAQNFELANVEVKAPVDGIVTGLNVFTRGGVVGAGARLLDIVPTDDALIVEGQLAVNLIDKVHVGLPVDLIFSAFNTNKTPHIPGEVIQVSADRTVDERSGAPYYKMRTRVTPAGAKLIAEHKLRIQPGMPVEMFVKTGERTMMSYLLKPVFDRAKTSMTEE